jgi:hypothetical protein
MRNGLILLWMLFFPINSASAQVSVGIGFPGVSIGINLPAYPELVPVPGYPVYYAPQVNSNYFFYDGVYWVYERDNWYTSSWYNGPWAVVVPEAVPLFVLRVPVRYYRQPPVYFRGWRSDAPPRWGEHWGSAWEQRRRGWDNWNRSAVPRPAPLPVYQRQYSGNRYPRIEQQQVLQSQNYRYQPRDTVVRQQYQAQQVQSAPASSPQGRQVAPQERISTPQAQRGSSPPSSQQGAASSPRGQPPQRGGADVQRPPTAPSPPQQSAPPAQYHRQPPPQGAVQQQGGPPGQNQRQQPPPGAVQREQPPHGQEKGAQGKGPPQEPKGQEKGREKGEQRGGERNQ